MNVSDDWKKARDITNIYLHHTGFNPQKPYCDTGYVEQTPRGRDDHNAQEEAVRHGIPQSHAA